MTAPPDFDRIRSDALEVFAALPDGQGPSWTRVLVEAAYAAGAAAERAWWRTNLLQYAKDLFGDGLEDIADTIKIATHIMLGRIEDAKTADAARSATTKPEGK